MDARPDRLLIELLATEPAAPEHGGPDPRLVEMLVERRALPPDTKGPVPCDDRS